MIRNYKLSLSLVVFVLTIFGSMLPTNLLISVSMQLVLNNCHFFFWMIPVLCISTIKYGTLKIFRKSNSENLI